MTFGLIVAIAATGIVIGIAIGAVGIGGVLLVPFLTLTLGIDVKHAIAAVLLSYVPSCIVAVALYARRGSIPWREAGLLCLAALPTAWLGAQAAQQAPAALLEAAIGVLLLAGGVYALLPPRATAIGRRRLAPATLLGLGGGTGFVSALTGAGGAFVLLPVSAAARYAGACGDRPGPGDRAADRGSGEPRQHRRGHHGYLARRRPGRGADAWDCDRHPDRACIAAASAASPSGFGRGACRSRHDPAHGGTAVTDFTGNRTT